MNPFLHILLQSVSVQLMELFRDLLGSSRSCVAAKVKLKSSAAAIFLNGKTSLVKRVTKHDICFLPPNVFLWIQSCRPPGSLFESGVLWSPDLDLLPLLAIYKRFESTLSQEDAWMHRNLSNKWTWVRSWRVCDFTDYTNNEMELINHTWRCGVHDCCVNRNGKQLRHDVLFLWEWRICLHLHTSIQLMTSTSLKSRKIW